MSTSQPANETAHRETHLSLVAGVLTGFHYVSVTDWTVSHVTELGLQPLSFPTSRTLAQLTAPALKLHTISWWFGQGRPVPQGY